jgi:subtilisin family serine protease
VTRASRTARPLARRTAALLGLLTLLVAPAVPASATPEPVASPRPVAAAPDTAAGGSGRVLLQLDTPYSPPGRLGPAARSRQSERLAAVRAQALRRVATAGARTLRTYDALPYVSVQASTSAVRELRSAPEVLAVLPDEVHRPALSSSTPFVGAPAAWAAGSTGAGQTVAVIDSGVDSTHVFLAGKVVDEACFSAGANCPNGTSSQLGAGAAAACTYDVLGCAHGTHVAGIVAGSGGTLNGSAVSGVAPGASIAAVQVFSRSTSGCPNGAAVCAVGYTSDLLAGLNHVATLARTRPVAAVNLSLGGGSYPASCDSAQPALKSAVDTLRNLGVVTVVSSGNSGSSSTISSPACLTGVVAVGSSSLTDVVSGFSASSVELDLLAPGERILSSAPLGNKAATMTGTSQATPHVAGAVAVLRSARPNATHAQLVTALTSTGKPVTDARNGRSTPRLRVDAALASLTGPASPGAGLPAPSPAPAPSASPAPTTADPTVPASSSRLSGSDRFDTAAQVYGAAFGCPLGGVKGVVLARGDAFADALAGSYLAGTLDSGVLLTGTSAVPAATLAALRSSGVQTVHLLGGTSAISDAVADQLARTPSYACDGTAGAVLKVVRLAGANRFDTARLTAESAGPGAVGTADLGSGPRRTAVLASGLGFADALAAGPLSYAGAADPARGSGAGFPTLLSSPGGLSPEARSALTSLRIEQVLVPGGTAVVSPAVVSSIEAMGIRVVRLAGANRTETAALVAKIAVQRLGFKQTTVTLARGDAFADALAGAAYAGDSSLPLLLTAGPTSLGAATRAYLVAGTGVTTGITAFGGDGAISARTLAEAVGALLR